jgi:aryl-alcohol dehydrogenase-like predicted oxidoreductase
LTERGTRILHALDEVAADTGASPAAVALAWAMARPGVTAPIASATSVAQLAELLRAASLTLSASAMRTLETASA